MGIDLVYLTYCLASPGRTQFRGVRLWLLRFFVYFLGAALLQHNTRPLIMGGWAGTRLLVCKASKGRLSCRSHQYTFGSSRWKSLQDVESCKGYEINNHK